MEVSGVRALGLAKGEDDCLCLLTVEGSAGSVKAGSPRGLLVSLLPLIAHCCREEAEPGWRRPLTRSGLFTIKVRTFSSLLPLFLLLHVHHLMLGGPGSTRCCHIFDHHWKCKLEQSENLPLGLCPTLGERETGQDCFSMWWRFAGQYNSSSSAGRRREEALRGGPGGGQHFLLTKPD